MPRLSRGIRPPGLQAGPAAGHRHSEAFLSLGPWEMRALRSHRGLVWTPRKGHMSLSLSFFKSVYC